MYRYIIYISCISIILYLTSCYITSSDTIIDDKNNIITPEQLEKTDTYIPWWKK